MRIRWSQDQFDRQSLVPIAQPPRFASFRVRSLSTAAAAIALEFHPLKGLDADPQGKDGSHRTDNQTDNDGQTQPESKSFMRERKIRGYGILLTEEIKVTGYREGRHDRENEDEAD